MVYWCFPVDGDVVFVDRDSLKKPKKLSKGQVSLKPQFTEDRAELGTNGSCSYAWCRLFREGE